MCLEESLFSHQTSSFYVEMCNLQSILGSHSIAKQCYVEMQGKSIVAAPQLSARARSHCRV